MIHDKTIRVGACDWDHAHWQESFYPDDLPEDWRLTYYANEFSCVLVPEDKWQDADLEEWEDSVPDGFLFYFLSSDENNEDAKIKGVLGDKFAGFVNAESDKVALIEVETKTLRQWKDWLQINNIPTIFLMDNELKTNVLTDFKCLIELVDA